MIEKFNHALRDYYWPAILIAALLGFVGGVILAGFSAEDKDLFSLYALWANVAAVLVVAAVGIALPNMMENQRRKRKFSFPATQLYHDVFLNSAMLEGIVTVLNSDTDDAPIVMELREKNFEVYREILLQEFPSEMLAMEQAYKRIKALAKVVNEHSAELARLKVSDQRQFAGFQIDGEPHILAPRLMAMMLQLQVGQLQFHMNSVLRKLQINIGFSR